MKVAIYVLPLSILAACASGPCKGQVKNTESTQPVAKSSPKAVMPAVTQTQAASPPKTGKVVVYKPDGSRQCSERVATPIEVMKKELTKAGIKVFASSKQRDGMMHTQVCGAATGMANTFEINGSDFEKAQKLGYARLEN